MRVAKTQNISTKLRFYVNEFSMVQFLRPTKSHYFLVFVNRAVVSRIFTFFVAYFSIDQMHI